MNITINKIMNGWLVALSSPKGQSALFYATFAEVLTNLHELETEFAKPPQPTKAAGK